MPICKKCLVDKPFSDYYTHPYTRTWFISTCKECKKAYQKTFDRRSYDRNRYHADPKRKAYVNRSTSERRKRKWYAHIHTKVCRKMKEYGRPDQCSICKNKIDGINILRIVFHHPDYMQPYQWVFCCEQCHSKIHLNKIDCKEFIIDLNK